MSPKSYASEITVIDGDEEFDFRIFMNHVLDHKGYRFFQSSYNDRGEVEQTFLSVNYDQIGTWTSYVGLFLFISGFNFDCFCQGYQICRLEKKSKEIKEKESETR